MEAHKDTTYLYLSLLSLDTSAPIIIIFKDIHQEVMPPKV